MPMMHSSIKDIDIPMMHSSIKDRDLTFECHSIAQPTKQERAIMKRQLKLKKKQKKVD